MSGLDTNLDISSHTAKCVADYVENLGIPLSEFQGRIADQDEMYHNAIAIKNTTDFAYFKYIESGGRTADVIKQVVDHYFDGPQNIGSFLEFASGHGRATRFMKHTLPKERYWVSDIYSDAMEFQRDYFKTIPLQSTEDPADFHCDRKFDFITVMSLFSHLPDGLFGEWLTKLGSLVADDGVLLISTREAGAVRSTPDASSVPESGLLFEETSESGSLSKKIYGLTAVTDAYVRQKIAECISPQADVQVFRRGLYLNQTVYLISKRSPAVAPIALKIPPTGGWAQNWKRTANGEAFMNGWAVDLNANQTITSVDVFLDDTPLGQATVQPYQAENFHVHFPGLENQPISWKILIPDDQITPNSIVKLRINSSTGRAIEFYAPALDC